MAGMAEVVETPEQKLKRHEDALVACMAEITKLREENARLRSSENNAHSVLREIYNDPDAPHGVRVKAAGLGPARHDCHIMVFAVANFAEALTKRRKKPAPKPAGRSGREHANYRRSALLGPCCKRPSSGNTAKETDELAPPHSITSSARSRIDGGTVRPSALAVLVFTAISNFTGT